MSVIAELCDIPPEMALMGVTRALPSVGPRKPKADTTYDALKLETPDDLAVYAKSMGKEMESTFTGTVEYGISTINHMTGIQRVEVLPSLKKEIDSILVTLNMIQTAFDNLPDMDGQRMIWLNSFPELNADWKNEVKDMLSWSDGENFNKALPYIENVMRKYEHPLERSDKRDAKERFEKLNEDNYTGYPMGVDDWVNFTHLLMLVSKMNAGTKALHVAVDKAAGKLLESKLPETL